MIAPSIYLSIPCRYCPRRISTSEAHLHGTPTGGYICDVCLAEQRKMDAEHQTRWGNAFKLMAKTPEEAAALFVEGDPRPCDRCHRTGGNERFLEVYEGKFATLCRPCSDWLMEHNRPQFEGTKSLFDRKVK